MQKKESWKTKLNVAKLFVIVLIASGLCYQSFVNSDYSDLNLVETTNCSLTTSFNPLYLDLAKVKKLELKTQTNKEKLQNIWRSRKKWTSNKRKSI